jgi:hypothetical protein
LTASAAFDFDLFPALQGDKMEEPLKSILIRTVTGSTTFHPIAAECITAFLDSLPDRTVIGLYGCGSIAQALLDVHMESLRRLQVLFILTTVGRENSYNGFPLASAASLSPIRPEVIIILSTRYEKEMSANLRYLADSKIMCLSDIFEYYGLEKLEKRICSFKPDILPEYLNQASQNDPASFLPRATLLQTRLRAVYQEIVLICLDACVDNWWDHPQMQTLWHFASRELVRPALREFVLRRAGDYLSFLRLSRELDLLGIPRNPEDSFVIEMSEHFCDELRAIDTLQITADPHRRPILLAFPVWGKAYLRTFLSICVPSLLDEGNIPTLCKHRKPVFLIHTDPEGKRTIEDSDKCKRLAALGVEIRFLLLDASLLAQLKSGENLKYWHLGMIQSVQLQFARSIGADYHIALPDYVYAAGYFDRLIAITSANRPVVLQTSFRTDIKAVESALDSFRSGDSISIAPELLTSMGLNHQHSASRILRMNDRPDRDQWPDFHCLLWEEESRLLIICPHPTIAFLGADIVGKIRRRFFFTLDSEMEKVLPQGAPVSFPSAHEGLVFLELSDDEAISPGEHYVDSVDYSRHFWSRIHTARHLRFFALQSEYPIDRETRSPRTTLNHEHTSAEMRQIRENVQNMVPPTLIFSLMNGLHAITGAETHPAAVHRLPKMRDAVRSIWHAGSDAITADQSADMVQVIVRCLMHWDLLPEAHECLLRHDPQSSLLLALDEFSAVKKACSALGAQYRAKSDAKPSCVIGSTIWGESYIEFFLNYHLPSLLTPGNLTALSRSSHLFFSIATDTCGRSQIERHPIYSAIRRLGEVVFSEISSTPERQSESGKRTFYQRYGLIDHYHLELARHLNARLILLPPDTVLSRNGLLTLASSMDRGYDCCTIACIEGNIENAAHELESFRCGPAIDVSASDLCSVAARHKTDYFRSLIMDDDNRLNAYPREFFWRVQGGYLCHSIFMHPLILSSRVLSRPFHPNYENVDWALLHRVLAADGRVEVLGDSSGLFMLHCSHSFVRANELSVFKGTVTPALINYLQGIHSHAYPIHRRLIRKAQFFSVPDPDFTPSRHYLEAAQALLASYEAISPVYE